MRLRTLFIIIGFLLFVIGMLSLVFVLIGANFTYLAWIDKPGSPRGLIIRLLMIGGGLVISYLALNPEQEEKEEINPDQQTPQEPQP
jgi:hypothetical protein